MKDKAKTKERFSELMEILQYNAESENFYQTAFENAGIATIIFKKDNTIVLVNGEFEKISGYTREEVECRKKWMEFVYRKDDLERMKEYHRLRDIDPLSAPRAYEFQLVSRDGLVKDIAATIATMPGTKQTLMTLLDINEHKQMGAALKESEKRLADIIDFLPDATFAVDLSGKVIAWNRAIEEMTGIKTEDMLGKGDHEYAIPFYGTRRPVLIDLVFEFDAETEKKYDFVKREGDVLLTETTMAVGAHPLVLWGKARPLYDNSGNVVGAIESVRDITALKQAQKALQTANEKLEVRVGERTTELVKANKALQKEIFERKRTEAVLKESEEKYNQFFKTSRDCVFITSKDGRLIDLNDAAVELLGYSSRKELLQMKIPFVYANEEEQTRHARTAAECGYTKEFPVDLRRKDGSVRHVLITAVARYDANGRIIGFQGTIRDITERRKIEEEREKLILELQEAISQVKILSGLLPICASCKKIRDDKGYWNQIESYIRDHSEAKFSHSICPDCAKRLYPEFYNEKEKPSLSC
ncbi:MAG: PAS domain S-box protein [Smithella sp.]